jgi:hypothetical protein
VFPLIKATTLTKFGSKLQEYAFLCESTVNKNISAS